MMPNYFRTRTTGPAPGGGFTLIEMMIVVAIIGILAAIAYPSYVEQAQRGKRADATTALMEAAQYMQRYYVAKSTFNDVVLKNGNVHYAPRGGQESDKTYEITVDTGEGRSFTLTATPSGWLDDKCGYLTLTDTGKKDAELGDVAVCWK